MVVLYAIDTWLCYIQLIRGYVIYNRYTMVLHTGDKWCYTLKTYSDGMVCLSVPLTTVPIYLPEVIFGNNRHFNLVVQLPTTDEAMVSGYTQRTATLNTGLDNPDHVHLR